MRFRPESEDPVPANDMAPGENAGGGLLFISDDGDDGMVKGVGADSVGVFCWSLKSPG